MGVTLFTIVYPANPLRDNTPRSALPVSALAHSRGPRKRSPGRCPSHQCHVLEHTYTCGQTQICSNSFWKTASYLASFPKHVSKIGLFCKLGLIWKRANFGKDLFPKRHDTIRALMSFVYKSSRVRNNLLL